jgi:hypothetical protein
VLFRQPNYRRVLNQLIAAVTITGKRYQNRRNDTVLSNHGLIRRRKSSIVDDLPIRGDFESNSSGNRRSGTRLFSDVEQKLPIVKGVSEMNVSRSVRQIVRQLFSCSLASDWSIYGGDSSAIFRWLCTRR